MTEITLSSIKSIKLESRLCRNTQRLLMTLVDASGQDHEIWIFGPPMDGKIDQNFVIERGGECEDYRLRELVAELAKSDLQVVAEQERDEAEQAKQDKAEADQYRSNKE